MKKFLLLVACFIGLTAFFAIVGGSAARQGAKEGVERAFGVQQQAPGLFK